MKPVQVLAITGGKGGVGKTNVSVNLSLALAEAGKRVILMDADLGLANVDIQLGLKADKTIAQVLSGECELRDILLTTTGGVKVIPASSGVQSLTQLGPQQHAGLISAFSDLDDQLDVLVIDTAAGISDSVVSFVRAAQEVMVVMCDEPSSITDAYALVKLLNRDYGMSRFRVLANMTRTPEEGRNLFTKFVTVAERFLDVTLQYAGDIPWDEAVRKSAQRQRAAIEAYPASKSAIAYRKLAEEVCQWPISRNASGRLQFFVERLLSNDADKTEIDQRVAAMPLGNPL
ncbi:MAG: MinD/ParA family protein [Gammaproteobacteria bacterium]|nr:MinD/ParA family protein [Gammaproteobacteria bacterium]MDP2140855.1 MinD/ParA family protein [Gammaproteobacteria bacterium]MDP2349402.1 MinD/ParA family protein [Gammaproteobacteria bacterium]